MRLCLHIITKQLFNTSVVFHSHLLSDTTYLEVASAPTGYGSGPQDCALPHPSDVSGKSTLSPVFLLTNSLKIRISNDPLAGFDEFARMAQNSETFYLLDY